MKVDYFDKAQADKVADEMAAKIAEVHDAAGHAAEVSGRSVTCDCGLSFDVSLDHDPLFGFVHVLTVRGDGRPFSTTVRDVQRDIVYGLHPLWGVEWGVKTDTTTILECRALGAWSEDAARRLREMRTDDLALMLRISNAVALLDKAAHTLKGAGLVEVQRRAA